MEKHKKLLIEGNDYVFKIFDQRPKILNSSRIQIKRKHEDEICNSCKFKAKDMEMLIEHANSKHGGVLYRFATQLIFFMFCNVFNFCNKKCTFTKVKKSVNYGTE